MTDRGGKNGQPRGARSTPLGGDAASLGEWRRAGWITRGSAEVVNYAGEANAAGHGGYTVKAAESWLARGGGGAMEGRAP